MENGLGLGQFGGSIAPTIIGYLLAASGPLLLGFLHTATGGWTIPVWVLLGVVALQLVTGWLAGRDLVLPALADTAVS